MKVNRQKLYHRGADFFALDGNAVMKLSREAAIEACLDAASQGLIAIKIEGGIGPTVHSKPEWMRFGTGPIRRLKEKMRMKTISQQRTSFGSQDPSYNAFIITSYSFGGSSSAADRALAAR